MNCSRRSIPALLSVTAAIAASPASAAPQPATQTLVFDSMANNRFLDRPPAGPSVGDTEYASASLRDASGRVVGAGRDQCVFTKVLANDVLERCSGSVKTREGTAALAGIGHLYSTNSPWQVTGRSGAYKGMRGEQVFAKDIPLDPNVPLAAGRVFIISVITLPTNRRLHVGVVSRPAANTAFIRRADAACRASEANGRRLPGFPFSNFNPFHPDPNLLPQVGRFFDQPARRRLPRALLRALQKLGQAPASRRAWHAVIKARRRLLINETTQTKAALAEDASVFVRTVYQQAEDYNGLVFASAIFGVQSCTFS